MLFDLKGKRKRLVQVTYVILAILFGGSLVLFGIGSDAPGGLVDAITGNNPGGGGDPTGTFGDQVEKAEKRVRLRPKDPEAWAALSQAEFNLARARDDYDQESGQFSEGAADTLEKATRAWERHLALKPDKPNATVALTMVQAYGSLLRFGRGSPLDTFEKAAEAQEIFADARPSPNSYFSLAAIRYQIGKIAQGDRAADEAIRRTPKDQRNVVRSQLEEVRKEGLKAKKEVKESERQAAKAAREARKAGQDPFGTPPGQTPLGQ
jgi:tetratricopeptide (TPR) repeat protein